jgi:CheY-like chemotaxis protein
VQKYDLHGTRVLLVDDMADNQVLIGLYLKIAGAQVDIAEDGEQGVQRALNGDYHVVLMDLQMPVLDGYGATGKLRAQGYSKPIVALTAYAMSTDRERCLRSGFDNHIPKPVNRGALLKEIARLAQI